MSTKKIRGKINTGTLRYNLGIGHRLLKIYAAELWNKIYSDQNTTH